MSIELDKDTKRFLRKVLRDSSKWRARADNSTGFNLVFTDDYGIMGRPSTTTNRYTNLHVWNCAKDAITKAPFSDAKPVSLPRCDCVVLTGSELAAALTIVLELDAKLVVVRRLGSTHSSEYGYACLELVARLPDSYTEISISQTVYFNGTRVISGAIF